MFELEYPELVLVFFTSYEYLAIWFLVCVCAQERVHLPDRGHLASPSLTLYILARLALHISLHLFPVAMPFPFIVRNPPTTTSSLLAPSFPLLRSLSLSCYCALTYASPCSLTPSRPSLAHRC